MTNSRLRFVVGLALVLAVAVTMTVLWRRSSAETAVRCLGGSEKSDLMADPGVREILRDRYRLTVDYQPLGSYAMVQRTADDLRAAGVTCLWPSSASAQSVFEARHGTPVAAVNLLQSPEVVYAGPRGTDALQRAGLVEERAGSLYLTGMKDLITSPRTWETLGATDLRGPAVVTGTDPVRSNSGFVLAQLHLAILATDDPYTAPSLAQARAALPRMRALHDAQGLQSSGSDAGFREWLSQGGEFRAPLFAGYENQVIQQAARSGSALAEVRVLYPEPTIYSDHPMIALDGTAAGLAEAMRDPEIHKIARDTYGFRSAVHLDLGTPAPGPGLAAQVRATPPPAADVTLALLACLSDPARCAEES